jgi:hypothetical protein
VLHDSEADDLTVLLRYEEGGRTQPLLEALLELRSGDGPSRVREAADRLVRERAPGALDVDASVSALLHAAGDDRTRALFAAWSSWRAPRPLQQLAAELGISGQRAGQIVHRGDSRIRAVLASSTGPVPWLVSTLRRRLGPVTTESQVGAALARLGLSEPAADLVVWLAGPYRPVPSRPAWLAVDAQAIVARTASCLAADGGVRRLVDVEAELGLPPDRLGPWLHVSDAVVVHDLAVSLVGPLPDVVERVLDAQGRARTASDIASCLAAGGRAVTEATVAAALRARRFQRLAGGAVGLADWNDAPPVSVRRPRLRPQDERRRAPSPVAPTPAPAPARVEAVNPARGDERLWLWVRVDAEVLRGAEAVVPGALVESLGVAMAARRTFSSRFGPIVLAHEGAQPVRGSVRAVALAAGARDDDTLLLGFSVEGDVVVEVRRAASQTAAPDPTANQLDYSNIVSGGTP